MGLSPFHPSPGTDSYAVVNNVNPDPKNFKILDSIFHEGYALLLVQYPNCTNYEGKKILLYDNTTEQQVRSWRTIDPHFGGKPGNLIARLRPDRDGMAIARRIMGLPHVFNS